MAWYTESNTGWPRVENDYVAEVVKAHPEAFVGALDQR